MAQFFVDETKACKHGHKRRVPDNTNASVSLMSLPAGLTFFNNESLPAISAFCRYAVQEQRMERNNWLVNRVLCFIYHLIDLCILKTQQGNL